MYAYNNSNGGLTMRVIITLFWSFCFSCLITYIIGSIGGSDFKFETALVLTFVFPVFSIIISSVLPVIAKHDDYSHNTEK